jgi:MocE subfamily Rieske [2Fe-2S] domain protein
VPYHLLPKLHQLIKDDCPEPYPSLFAAYREIVPAVLRQIKDPGYFVERRLPATAKPAASIPTESTIIAADSTEEIGWVSVCDPAVLGSGEVIRFDHDNRTFAVYRTTDGSFHATDGICTHGKTHLADGLLTGRIIECPKHNGRFDITDGSPQRRPACVALRTYPVKLENGRLFLNAGQPGGGGRTGETTPAEVEENRDVAASNKTIDP